jgi:hypothetical protein
VYALAVSGSDLYAGGFFTTAGGTAANNIAKWNGTSWSPLGSGIAGTTYPYVYALAVSGSNLYVGGAFTTAGGTSANYIAKWNGTNWSPLGSGVTRTGSPPYVYALAVAGSNLYAGGAFLAAGSTPAYAIAKWDGSSWSALGEGMNGFVYALAASGSDVYAGGDFTGAGGTSANYMVNHIAKWNGSSWSPLGSGMDFAVQALAVSANHLYAGGWFSIAGGKVSAHAAKARIGSIARSLVATNSTASIEFSGVTGYQYDVQRATSMNPPIIWATVTTSPLSPDEDGYFTFTDTTAPPGTAYYRAVER